MIKPAAEIEYELRHELRIDYVRAPVDSEIFLPSVDWLRQFGRWLAANPPSPYVAEAWDCDDFAIWARVEASKAWLAARDERISGHGLGYCEVWTNSHEFWSNVNTGLGKHAWNLCKTRDDGWHFLEPQTGRTIEYEKAKTPDYDGPVLGVTFVWM